MVKTTAKKNVVEETTLTEGIIAIDNGGYNTKVLTEQMEEPICIPSQKMFGHDNFVLTQKYPEGSYKIHWNGKWYFMGGYMRESTKKLHGFHNTKSHEFFIVSLLQAVALHGFDRNFVVTCVPYSRFRNKEVEAIRSILIDTHTLEINGVEHTFEICDATVVSEGATACLDFLLKGYIRWLDLGSRTVGFATSYHDEDTGYGVQIENGSGTIEKEGLDITNLSATGNYDEYVSNISDSLSREKWDDEDTIYVFGGGALIPQLIEALRVKYPNIVVTEDPLNTQVKAMLTVGISEFRGDDSDEYRYAKR